MKITARAPRKEYERRIAPRSLFRILLQKLLHQWARGCIPAFLRLRLYRAMGVAIGGNAFAGLHTRLRDQLPQLVRIVHDAPISFRVTGARHLYPRRMTAGIP